MIVATPDFGAGGMVVLILIGLSLIVLAISAIAIIRGLRLIHRRPHSRKSFGILLILSGIVFPVSCFATPSVLFRLHHDTPPLGRYPNNVVRERMSADEVRGLLGNPHKVNDRDKMRVTWTYWLDAIKLDYFMVTFGPDGKVSNTSGS